MIQQADQMYNGWRDEGTMAPRFPQILHCLKPVVPISDSRSLLPVLRERCLLIWPSGVDHSAAVL